MCARTPRVTNCDRMIMENVSLWVSDYVVGEEYVLILACIPPTKYQMITVCVCVRLR